MSQGLFDGGTLMWFLGMDPRIKAIIRNQARRGWRAGTCGDPANPEQVKNVEMVYALKNPVWLIRAWRDAQSVKNGDVWVAKMPVLNVEDYDGSQTGRRDLGR